MTRFKSIVLILVLLVLTFSFTACSNSKSTFSGSKTGNNNQFLVDFDVLNKTVNHDMELLDGDSIETTIKIEKGNVDILIKNYNDTIIYQGNDVESGNFFLNITESGNYSFSITGQKAKGSVHFIKSPSDDVVDAPSIAVQN